MVPAISRLTISESSPPAVFHRALAAPTLAPAVPSSAEAQIQSWAGGPTGAALGTWVPGTSINFAPRTAASRMAGGGSNNGSNSGSGNANNGANNNNTNRVPGVWDPSAGIRFG